MPINCLLALFALRRGHTLIERVFIGGEPVTHLGATGCERVNNAFSTTRGGRVRRQLDDRSCHCRDQPAPVAGSRTRFCKACSQKQALDLQWFHSLWRDDRTNCEDGLCRSSALNRRRSDAPFPAVFHKYDRGRRTAPQTQGDQKFKASKPQQDGEDGGAPTLVWLTNPNSLRCRAFGKTSQSRTAATAV